MSIPGGLTINTLLLTVVGTRGVQTCRGGARPDINTSMPAAPKLACLPGHIQMSSIVNRWHCGILGVQLEIC